MSHKSLRKEMKKISTINWHLPSTFMSFSGGSVVKNLPARQELQEIQVRFPGQEDRWRREWQPAPVFLPGEFHGQRSLVGSMDLLHDWSDLAHMHASTSTRIKSCVAAAADLQHPLKGVKRGKREWGICAQGKIDRTGLQTGIFRRFYEPDSYTFSYIEKH